MATFKLGAFVTDISGSIGGTTFKRGTGNKILLNKTRGASRNSLLKNNALPKNAQVFRAYNQLSTTEKEKWEGIKNNYQFPDKYGVYRSITARQLFNKLNLQLSPANQMVTNADTVFDSVPTSFASYFQIDPNTETADISVFTTPAQGYILFQIEVSSKPLTNPKFTRRKITAFAVGNIGPIFNIYAELMRDFPYLNSNYYVRAYITNMNTTGFKNTPITIDAVFI
jgi:hypothetical protein